jgi:hypothetical protein
MRQSAIHRMDYAAGLVTEFDKLDWVLCILNMMGQKLRRLMKVVALEFSRIGAWNSPA